MRRRALIRRALLIFGLNPLALTGCLSRGTATGSLDTPAAPGPGPAGAGLSADEIEDLVALGEALVEGRVLAPAERRYLVEHIEGRGTESPALLKAYRSAATTIARLAGRRFATLEMAERLEIMRRHRLAARATGHEEEAGPFREEIRVLRTRTVPDLIHGYYGSPAGWQVVGYESFPGRCGDLMRYTRPEA